MIFVITGTGSGAVVMVMVRSRVLEIIFNSNTGKVLAVRRQETGKTAPPSHYHEESFIQSLTITIQYNTVNIKNILFYSSQRILQSMLQ